MALERMPQSLYYAPFATIALIHGAFGFFSIWPLPVTTGWQTAGTRFRMPGWRIRLAPRYSAHGAARGAERAFVFLRDALVINAEQALAQQFITEIADEVTWSRRIDEIAATNAKLPPKAYAQLEGDAADQHRGG